MRNRVEPTTMIATARRIKDRVPVADNIRNNLIDMAWLASEDPDDDGEATNSIPQLRGLCALATMVDDLIGVTLSEVRAEGYSWTEIGKAMNMSKQAAQQRYGKRVLGAGVGKLRAEGGG